jgi:hypothetical protein
LPTTKCILNTMKKALPLAATQMDLNVLARLGISVITLCANVLLIKFRLVIIGSKCQSH